MTELCCTYSAPYFAGEPWICRGCGMRYAVRCSPEPAADVHTVELSLADEIAQAMALIKPTWFEPLRTHWAADIEAATIERHLDYMDKWEKP